MTVAVVRDCRGKRNEGTGVSASRRRRFEVGFGCLPVPVPEPLGGLLPGLLDARANMNTASNPGSKWLLPGGRAEQPLTPGALRQRFQASSTAALSQLVLQARAPVVAGGRWSRYTASRHDDARVDSAARGR